MFKYIEAGFCKNLLSKSSTSVILSISCSSREKVRIKIMTSFQSTTLKNDRLYWDGFGIGFYYSFLKSIVIFQCRD